MTEDDKTYLYDGVTAWLDGGRIWLQHEKKDGTSQTVALDPTVFELLIEFAKSNDWTEIILNALKD